MGNGVENDRVTILLRRKLDTLYPDGKIKDIQTQKNVYERLVRVAPMLGFDGYEDLVRSWGFTIGGDDVRVVVETSVVMPAVAQAPAAEPEHLVLASPDVYMGEEPLSLEYGNKPVLDEFSEGQAPMGDGTIEGAAGVVAALRAFRDERDWSRFHTPKDLACAISVEAAELLDAFRWSGPDTGVAGREDKVREELADVMIYCLYLADAIGEDPAALIADKLALNEGRYPADKSRGSAAKYTEL